MIYGPKKITVAGGNLFRVAAEHLGDSRDWYRIALASGLTDPWLEGTVTLTIPPRSSGSSNGGILEAV